MTDLPFRNPAPATVTDDELSELTAFANELADASREVIAPLFRSGLAIDGKEGKGYYDPVTEADRGAEAAIRALIKERYPDHTIFGEEFGYEPGTSPLTWTLDPVDGTRPFVLGLPTWGTLIALHDGAKPLLGVLDQPFLEERFIGVPQIAYAKHISRSGTSNLKVRACDGLSVASLSSTHPSMFDKEPHKSAYETLASKVRLHAYGGDCYGFAIIGLGTHDLAVETGLAPYDIQALIPIIEAAGGIVTAWDGGPADLGGTVVAASSREVHAEALEILKAGV
jgi:myo-inositol-1(or 4)-monophosphatase